MKMRYTGVLALLATLALVIAFFPNKSQAQAVATISSGPTPFTTTASQGSLPYLAISGQSNCTDVVVDSASGTSITVQGASDSNQVSQATLVTNTNFGSSGVITVTTTPQNVSGNIASFPKLFGGTFTGNTGTLSVTETCSGATGLSSGGGGGSNVTVINTPGVNVQNTVSVAIVSPNPLNVNAVNTPAPTALPSGSGYPTPASLPDIQAYLKCVGASPNPGPSPGYAGVCSFDTKGAVYTNVDNFPLPGPTDLNGNPIFTISSGSTVTVGGLRVPEATPTPTAMPSELPVAAVHYAYTGSGVLEADISCIETTPVVLTISSSTDTPVIEGAGSGALRIALCGSEGSSTGTGTGYLELSTSATCASGFTAIERNFSFTANGGFEHHMQWAYYRLPAGDSLCYHSVWTSGVQSITVYATGPF